MGYRFLKNPPHTYLSGKKNRGSGSAHYKADQKQYSLGREGWTKVLHGRQLLFRPVAHGDDPEHGEGGEGQERRTQEFQVLDVLSIVSDFYLEQLYEHC